MGGGETDWVGKKLTIQVFPRGKNWPVSFSLGKNWLGKKLTVTPANKMKLLVNSTTVRLMLLTYTRAMIRIVADFPERLTW